jgi:dTDP-4-amino-4,6-dideoxygalactose transaminase
MGPEVAELESALAEKVGVGHCVSCANGTDALQLALMALGVGQGDAVFTPTYTFFATAEAISLVGATPVFVDVDPQTFNIDSVSLRSAIGEVIDGGENQATAIIAVDLFGLPADYGQLEVIADEFDLHLIEDAAQGMGGSIDDRSAGTFGVIATTSFFPAKPLGCYGDGGAVFTDSNEIADAVRSLRVHGKGSDKYDNVRIGMNSRLDTLQAAVLLAKLERFCGELEVRQTVADWYDEYLPESVQVPEIPDGYQSAWAQYTVRSDQRDKLKAALTERGIPTAIYYVKPLHLMDAYQSLGYSIGDFPVSERLSRRALSLPMHPYLNESLVKEIAGAVASL